MKLQMLEDEVRSTKDEQNVIEELDKELRALLNVLLLKYVFYRYINIV